MSRPALFLDRDGVINIDHGYVYKPCDIDFVDGIFHLVKMAKQAGYLVVVITNQAGIGRGYYTESDFHALMHWMLLQFEKNEGKIDAVYFSPYHPQHGIGKYLRQSDCRKPSPGMLLRAQHELNIDMHSSILIGDNVTDMEAGEAAGVGTLLLLSEKKNNESKWEVIPRLDSLFLSNNLFFIDNKESI